MYKFEIKSGKMVVSDPCYTLDIGGHSVLENVKNGNWVGHTEFSDQGDWGERVCALLIQHESCPQHPSHLENIDVGVDSGQAGFFDLDSYRNDDLIKEEPKFDFNGKEVGDKWYAACCDKTIGEDHGGDVPNGVVSSSGMGDGCYKLYTHRDKDGLLVAAKIVFIEEEDECDVCGNPESRCECCVDCGQVDCVCNEESEEDTDE